MRIRAWLAGWTDRRRSSRIRVELLQAYYWTGAVPRPVEVRDISLYGAYILAGDSFYPATLLQIVLSNKAKAGSHICVCAQVRRKTLDGFCVSFLFGEFREKRLLREFLEGVIRRAPNEVQAAAPGKADQPNAMEPFAEVQTIGKDQVDVAEVKGATGAMAENEGNGPSD